MADASAPPPRVTDEPQIADILSDAFGAYAHALENIERMVADLGAQPALLADVSLGEEIAYARRHMKKAANSLASVRDMMRAKADA